MTSVLGHLTNSDFEERYNNWKNVDPRELFAAPIKTEVNKTHLAVSRNIERESRSATKLFIWTDCDREGEHIGWEIASVAKKSNRGLRDTDIQRAVFNNVEASHVQQAANNPQQLDMRQVRAVEARMEVDLRIGAAFTRFQTLTLQNHFRAELDGNVVSYGPCQFPTLGFIVDQYKRVKNFVPETFWYISIDVQVPTDDGADSVKHEVIDLDGPSTKKKPPPKKGGKKQSGILSFSWERNHLFDHLATTVIFERCADKGYKAQVDSIVSKSTSKWRPLPLTTVELQKLGAQFFGLSSKRIMEIAESLYNKGYISYPRTETDQFDAAMDLQGLVRKQFNSPEWGGYARGLLNEEQPQDQPPFPRFTPPRKGKLNDKAHPPIHPVIFVARDTLETPAHYEVYKFITRRFLACCSPDALGSTTTVTLDWAGEKFKASGLIVHERNYLDIYPYQKWESSDVQIPPDFFRAPTLSATGDRQYQTVGLHAADLKEGKTSPPKFLTEPELIGLMDLNGIGTDATMAEHIDTILQRSYVFKHMMSGAGANGAADGTGRGRGRGRTATATGTSSGPLPVFIPSTLGIALVEGYDLIGFDMSLSKPFLRKEMEDNMRAIIDGRMTKQQVVSNAVTKYRDVYELAKQQSAVLVSTARRYFDAANREAAGNGNNEN